MKRAALIGSRRQNNRTAMFSPLIVDLRNMYSRDKVEASGFTYVSIGQSEHPMELGGGPDRC